MTRSALSYPLSRAADMDAGGAADLQTDVMRFMAILSLCLVAIFALVQSIPLSPVLPEPETVRIPDLPKPAQKAETRPQPEPQPKPEPVPTVEPPPKVVPEAPPEVLRELPPRPVYEPVPTVEPANPVPLASSAAPVPEAVPVPPIPEPRQEGFTLRFESDLALRRLVARNDIGLYAILDNKAQRMNVNRGALSFWPASMPAEFHEMEQATVPTDVVSALRRSGTAGTVKWGVTLPANLRRDLDRFLNSHSGGALIIDGQGRMRLE